MASHPSYSPLPTADPAAAAPGPSASSSLSSSPLQHAIAALHPLRSSTDDGVHHYELDEKASFLQHSRSTPHRSHEPHSQHARRTSYPWLSWLSPSKSIHSDTKHGFLTAALELLQRTKTYLLLAVCAVLALLLVLDRSPAAHSASATASAPAAATASSSSSLATSLLGGSAPHRIEDDIVLITKVGSATMHHRLLVHLAEQPLSNVYAPHRLYVSDLPARIGEIGVFDALANVSETIRHLDDFRTLRAQLELLQQGHQDLGATRDRDAGWKLDKYKFLPMLAEAWRRFPHKKWYVVVEADTFVFWNQLVRWLATLDPRRQLLLGHPTFCDYDGVSTMFTHGGSGFVLSGALVEQTFGRDDEFEHHHDALIQKSAFGDALLSKAIYDSPGVTLSELSPDGRERFNSDPPRVLKFHRQNWCEALVTLHHVTPTDAAQLYEFMRRIDAVLGEDDSLRWSDVWSEFKPDFLHRQDQDGDGVVVEGWQSIEEWDTETTDVRTSTALECQQRCADNEACLMWQWRPESAGRRRRRAVGGECRWTKDFLRIGVTKPDQPELTTGWMPTRVRAWEEQNTCRRHAIL